MRKLSKILVLVLTLSLLLGMFAVFASAATNVAKIGDTEYATLADAVSAAAPGDTITLVADTTVSATITVSKEVTIDLNDYTITTSVSLFTVTGAGAKLTVKNGTIHNTTTSGKDIVTSTGSAEVEITLQNIDANISSNFVVIKAPTKCLVEGCTAYGPACYGGFFLEQKANLVIRDSVIAVRQQALYFRTLQPGSTYDFYNTVFMGYGGGNAHGLNNSTAYGRLIRCDVAPAPLTNEYTYADGGTDTQKTVIDNSMPDVNFYNCEIYSYGDRVFTIGPLNWHIYGGYVGSYDYSPNRIFSAPSNATQTYQIIEIAPYEDPDTRVISYPTFNYDLANYNGLAIKGYHDVTVTATGTTSDGVFTPTSVATTKKAGTTGEIYATDNGYAWVPKEDTSVYAEAIRAEASDAGFVTSYFSGFMKDVTSQTNASTVSNLTFSYGSHSIPAQNQSTSTFATAINIANLKFTSPKGDYFDPYFQARWNAAEMSGISNSSLVFNNGPTNTINANYTMANIDYVAYDIDVKAPENGSILGKSTSMVLAGDGDVYSDDNKILIKANGDKMSLYDGENCISGDVDLNDGKWHHFTFILKIDHTDYTNCTYNFYLDGTLIYSKATAGTFPDASRKLYGICINLPGGTYAEGEGYAFDNWRSTLYGFSAEGATGYTGFENFATETNLSNFSEYQNYEFRTDYAAGIGDTYYGTYAEAYAAANPGDRIELYADVAGEQSVAKAVTVDTNGYAFSYNSICEYKIGRHGTGNNVVTFTVPEESEKLTFTWQRTDGTAVTIKSVKGNVPNDDYSTYAPALDAEYGYDAVLDKVTSTSEWTLTSSTENNFVYEPKASTVDDALFVILNTETGAYISHGTTFDKFYAAVNRPSTNVATTLKLLRDLDFTSDEFIGIEGAHKPFTLDLNGHTFDDQNVTRYASNKRRGVFRPVGTDGAVFNITSSKEGARIIHTNPKDATTSDQFIWVTSNSGITVNIDGDITYFGARFVATGYANTTVNIKNVTMIQTGSGGEAFFHLYSENAKLSVSNSKIYSAGTSSATNVLAGQFQSATATFDNCEILSLENTKPFFEPSDTNGVIGTVTFNNCKIFANIAPYAGTETKVVLAGDTIVNSSDLTGVTVEEGRTLTKVDAAGVKTDLKYSGFALGSADEGYEFKHNVDVAKYTFTHTTMAEADLAKIEWTLGGEVKATTKYIPGLEEQTYTKTGKVLEGFVINTYEASKTAALEAGTVQAAFELAKTETYIDGLMYNLNLDSSMSINLAIPKAAYESAGFTVTDGTNALVGTPTVIGEADYYLVTLNSIDAISTTEERTFVLKVGNAEAQTVTLSVAGYAAQLLENGANDVEKELARAILQYALDAEKSLDKDDADAIAELTALLGTKVDTGVKNNSFGTVHNTDALANTDLYGVFLRLDNNPGIVFEADDGKTVTFTVTYGSVTKTMEITKAGGEVVLDLKVYNFDTELTINVGGVDYSYNLATYLTGLCDLKDAEPEVDALNEALANSIYNLVKAAQAYRAQ